MAYSKSSRIEKYSCIKKTSNCSSVAPQVKKPCLEKGNKKIVFANAQKSASSKKKNHFKRKAILQCSDSIKFKNSYTKVLHGSPSFGDSQQN